jgi:hypothetical protein
MSSLVPSTGRYGSILRASPKRTLLKNGSRLSERRQMELAGTSFLMISTA